MDVRKARLSGSGRPLALTALPEAVSSLTPTFT